MPLKPELTEEEFERIDRALFAVLESPSDFGGLLYEFAAVNAERLERYGRRAYWSEAQWDLVDKIERIQRGEDVAQKFSGST